MRRVAVVALALACHASPGSPAPPSPPDAPQRSCASTISFKPAAPVIQVYAAGEWNGFSPTADRLRDAGDGTYALSLTLPAGEYAYKLVVDGQYQLDPANPWTRYAGGIENSALRVPDCRAPLVEVKSWTVAARALDATLQISRGAAELDASGFSASLDGAPLAPASFSFDGVVTLHAGALSDGKHVVRVHFADRAGTAARDLYLPWWIEPQPFQWNDATLYFAMVDRFANGDSTNDAPVPGVDPPANFMGGDYAGLEAQLDAGWFDALGVRAIWLSNPQKQPAAGYPGSFNRNFAGYHGYWPASDSEVDPRFGTLAELQAVVDTAHRHGIRVLLDFVANHVHEEHPWWNAHQSDGFFNPLHLADGRTCLCDAAGAAAGHCSYDAPEGLVCWFAPYLPDLNYTDPRTAPAIEQLAVDWLERTGADGLRVDAVKQFPHIVGTRLRARLHEELESTGVPVYLVGETFVGGWSSGGQDLVKQYVGPRELSGQFDFPLYWEIRSALADQSSDFRNVEAALSGEQGFYGPGALMSPFIGNHDLPRFVSVAAGQNVDSPFDAPPPEPADADVYARQQLAFTLLFTIPGMPLLWQGDEFAMPGANDPDNRRMMKFSGFTALQQGVLDRVRALGTLRQRAAALRRGGYQTLLVEPDVLVYARQVPGAPATVVALNRSTSPQQRTLAISPSLLLPAQIAEALGGAAANVTGGQLSLSLPARAGAIYVP